MKEVSQSERNQRKIGIVKREHTCGFEEAASTGCAKRYLMLSASAVCSKRSTYLEYRRDQTDGFEFPRVLLEMSSRTGTKGKQPLPASSSATPLVGNAFVLQLFKPRISNNNSGKINSVESKIFAE